MSEPTLPALPDSLLTLKPKSSGACPPKAILFMFLIALPINLIWSMVAHYLGIVFSFLAMLVLLLNTYADTVCVPVSVVSFLFTAIFTLLVIFVYPITVGRVSGAIVGRLGKIGHCRNSSIAGWAGGLSGLFTYIGHSLVSLYSDGRLCPIITVYIKKLDDDLNVIVTHDRPWWLFVVMALEFLVVIIATAVVASSAISDSPYCETHKTWYGRWQRGVFSVSAIQAVANAMQTRDVRHLESIVRLEQETYPHLVIKTRGCPSSPLCDVEIMGTAFWQVTSVDKNGNPSTETKSKSWFDLMMPSAFGHALEKALGMQEKLSETEKA